MSLLGDMALAIKQKLNLKLDAAAYTASDVLSKIKTVDGDNSGLDADLLKGLNSTNLNTINTVVVRDGAGNFSANIITANLTGNASTATKLQTIRTINGVSFDGTANITIADDTKLPLAGGILTGPLTGISFNGITGFSDSVPLINGIAAAGTSTSISRSDHIHPAQTTITGNAGTATALQVGRTISITGDLIYTSPAFNGSANIAAVGTLANSGVTAGTYNNSATLITPFMVDAKGRITGTGAAVTITPAWSNITSKPTTVAGYGISDVYTIANTYSKSEVDSLVQGFRGKASATVATTAALTFNTAQTTIDGVTISITDRVLIKNQANAAQNGIYTNVTTTAWVRAENADTAEELTSALVFVDKGTLNRDTAWLQTTDDIVLGTSSLNWIQFANSGSYAPLVHTHSATDITSGILPVARGGTGVSTITGLIKGNGTGAMTAAIAGIDYVLPSGSIAGNAATATKLAIVRTINGTNFDGTADITITDDTKQPLDSDLTSIAGLIGTSGLLRKNAANSWSLDTTTYLSNIGITLPLTSTGGANPTLGINVVTTSANGIMTASDKIKLDSIAANANNYVLPVASSTVLGGVKAGANITIDANGVISTANNSTISWGNITSTPTSLSGYNIQDAYTKTQVQESLPAIGLDTANILAPTRVGQFKWNQDEGTADLALDNGVTLQLGQENIKKVRNNTGSTILNGRIVKSVSSIGNSGRITVAPFSGLVGEARLIYGITTQDILPGGDGFITTNGKVRNIDTTGTSVGEVWADGQLLYAKPNNNGAMTNIMPADNELKVVVARVVHAHIDGTLDMDIHSIIDENAFVSRPASSSVDRLVKFENTTGKIKDSNLISNSRGDLGLNVIPSSWHPNARAIETAGGSLFNLNNDSIAMIQNAYYATNGLGGFYSYKNTGLATMYRQKAGEHIWYTAQSGAGGTGATFEQKMKLDSSGVLKLGLNTVSTNIDIENVINIMSKFNANPNSDSGIITTPMVINEAVEIPAGRMAILANTTIGENGSIDVFGDVFIPSGSSFKDVDEQVAILQSELMAIKSTISPAGTIILSASQLTPSGHLKANGALVSRTAYSALFAAIGTTYGQGDGSTTFALPDLRSQFIRGFDDGKGIDVVNIASWSYSGTTITINTTGNHGITVGQTITISGLVSATNAPNGNVVVTSIVDGDTFTFIAVATPTGTATVSSAKISRAFGSIQTDGVGGYTVTAYQSRNNWAYGTGSTTGGSLPTAFNDSTGETRPKNIALMYYIKY